MTWRDHARPIIHAVLCATRGKTEQEIKAALRAAYPFGERLYHPYRIWCDEIRVQRGLKKPRAHRTNGAGHLDAEASGQLQLKASAEVQQ